MWLVALVAVLEYAAGAEHVNDAGQLLISVEQVQLARRLRDVNLRIREAFRAPVGSLDVEGRPENAEELAKRLSTPVALGYAGDRCAPHLSSQIVVQPGLRDTASSAAGRVAVGGGAPGVAPLHASAADAVVVQAG